MAVTREQKVEQSVQDYATLKLRAAGWSEKKLEMLDEFPYEKFEGKLDHSYVAFGFNFDDEGAAAEMGSDLKKRIYTLEFFVFGRSPLEAKAIANQIKFALDADEIVPLKDIGEIDAPVIDALVVVGCKAEKMVVPDPAPYQESVWLTTCRVEDVYYSSQA
jgi:hypothetical protein